MNPAIIRLAKKLVITSDTPHPELKRLWTSINDQIEGINSRLSKRLSWHSVSEWHKKNLISEATQWGEGTRQLLRNRLPQVVELSAMEWSFVIERTRTEIAGFTDQPLSLVLHYFLITEPLLLIDNMGESLLLAKGDEVKALQEGTTITNTFILSLQSAYEIVEYTRIKF